MWIEGDKKTYHLIPQDTGWKIDSISFAGIDIGGISAIHPDNGGITWLGGNYGLVRYDANIDMDYQAPYPCLITKVTTQKGEKDSLLYGGFTLRDSLPTYHRLPYAQNNLTFSFTATEYHRRDALRYSWKLEGYDDEWSPFKDEEQVNYTNLPEGRYVFKVKARNVYKHESKVGEYRFEIKPPYYRTLAFYLYQGGGLLLLFGIALICTRYLQYGWAGVAGMVIGTITIFIVFEYAQNWVEQEFSDVLGGVVFYKVLLNVGCAMVLFPMELLINSMLGIKIVRIRKGDKAQTLFDKGKDEGKQEGLSEGRNNIIAKLRELGVSDEVIKRVKGK